MTADEFVPLRAWEPELGTDVVDWRDPNTVGVVVACDRYGHYADPYWRVSVRWPGWVQHDVETSRLTRPDGTQGRR